MNVKQIDSINILLLVTSLLIAIFIPFKLFLFSYAVLGPLHYLTEINWLKKKEYFLNTQNKWSAVFVILAILISIAPVLRYLNEKGLISFKQLIEQLESLSTIIILSGFLFAISFLFFKKSKFIGSALILTISIAALINYFGSESSLLFGLFLPTLIHVYVFTFFFILYGAFKAKSKMGLYLATLLLSIPLIIRFLPIEWIVYQPSLEVKNTFVSSKMLYVSASLANLIGDIERSSFNPLSDLGIRIHIFIAFAYTYHYLNWFSKTSIIGWRKAINTKKAIYIGLVWVISIGLYFYNYKTGFIALFFLSYLHVFLELPLNMITIKETFNLKRD